jgi:hypothetical protein
MRTALGVVACFAVCACGTVAVRAATPRILAPTAAVLPPPAQESRWARLEQTPAARAERDELARLEFERVDVRPGELESLDIVAPDPNTTPFDPDMRVMLDRVGEASQRAQAFAERLEAVVTHRSPTWTLAAYGRQGEIYARLASSILLAFSPTRTGTSTLTPRQEQRIHEALATQVEPIFCLAIVRWMLVVRAGRAGELDTEATREAHAQLLRHPEERIEHCVAEQRARDSTFTPYVRGERALTR